MLKVVEMDAAEQIELIDSMNFGHLACAHENQPYIVPMHYAFDGEYIYFLTTEGVKTKWLDGNPKVCFQIEKVMDERHWQSVIILGCAARLSNAEDIGRATNFIFKKHSSLTPALNETIVHGKEKFDGAAIYSVRMETVTGRKTARL